MNKVLVELYVPKIEKKYEIFLPISKQVRTVIRLLVKSLNEITNQEYPLDYKAILCDKFTGNIYDLNKTIKELNIMNGAKLILI